MLQAEIAKLRSNCIVRQVGAVIVSDRRQITSGYNGTPSGVKNCFDGGCPRCQTRMQETIISGEDRCVCNHAEANAIMHYVILGTRLDPNDNTTLYTTFTPCLECSKMAITVGIRRVVCLDSYLETDHKLLQEAGVAVVPLEKERIRHWIEILLEEPKC